MQNGTPSSASPAALTPEVNGIATSNPSQENGETVPTVNVQNQPPSTDGEGRGKKKSLLQGRGRGLGVLAKGRGPSTPGWTGAGFDVDTGS